MLKLNKQSAVIKYQIASCERYNPAVVEEFDDIEDSITRSHYYADNFSNAAEGYDVVYLNADKEVCWYSGDVFEMKSYPE